ncbi:hypothetical protein GUJ93_ZPchr0004g39784 [Zizania palustris]|uniref:Uncharacterized protein n=1 Tax=Zizania palustris TaxID=103762 RepID=A0A8J5SAN8_ZIZPA|nr:hypothetical protein GUJ93_ZPchr0004g39784 [Zizania palustris]
MEATAPATSADANGSAAAKEQVGAPTNPMATAKARVGAPTNPMATALLTDQYQFSMAYAYWKAGKHADRAV